MPSKWYLVFLIHPKATNMKFDKPFTRISISGVIGAILGYAYYYFIGCNSGGCPLTSNWYVTTLYGFVSGVIVGLPTKKKSNEQNRQENNNRRSGE